MWPGPVARPQVNRLVLQLVLLLLLLGMCGASVVVCWREIREI